MRRFAAAIDTSAGARTASGGAVLRLAGGVVFGVAIGLLTLGLSGAASHEQQVPLSTEDPAVAVAIPAARPVKEEASPSDAPLRIRGRVGDGPYSSLIEVGVTPAEAGEFLAIVARRLNLTRDVGPDDNFDLVLAPGAAGARATSR